MDIPYQEINSKTIDRWVEEGWEWGKPVSHEEYEKAKAGTWDVKLTPVKFVPHSWLGELKGNVKSILRQMQQEREDAKDSRARVYDRVERVEESVTIAGQVAAQARDKANAIEKLVSDEVKPQTDKLRLLGLKGGGFLAGAAMMGGLVAQPFWTAIASAFEKITK